jgi:N-acyl homoserine lactone hydrolase
MPDPVPRLVFRSAWKAIGFIIGLAVAGAAVRPLAELSGTEGLKLYIFDCGTITNANTAQYHLEKDHVVASMAVPCYLIVHPKGTLLWDTGVGDSNGDTRPLRYTPGSRTLKAQLSEIGYPPNQITYLALSHSHADHTGNANDYFSSTLLIQKAEYQVMFAEKANTTNYQALKSSKTKLLTGDYDVFEDGTVVLKLAPGHTPGHQVLFVKLSRTGPVVLSGDLYHWTAERTLDRMPDREREQGQTKMSRVAVDDFIIKSGATLWVQHDIVEYSRLNKSPAYYD